MKCFKFALIGAGIGLGIIAAMGLVFGVIACAIYFWLMVGVPKGAAEMAGIATMFAIAGAACGIAECRHRAKR